MTHRSYRLTDQTASAISLALVRFLEDAHPDSRDWVRTQRDEWEEQREDALRQQPDEDGEFENDPLLIDEAEQVELDARDHPEDYELLTLAERLTNGSVPTVRQVAAACPAVLDWVAVALENELSHRESGLGDHWTQEQRDLLRVFIMSLRSGGLELPGRSPDLDAQPEDDAVYLPQEVR
jgi:hypothetical protein